MRHEARMIRNVRSLELESPAYLKATARECVNSHNRACKDSSAETSIPKVLSSLRAHCACHCASAIEIPRTHWLHRLSLKLPSGQKKQHDQLKQSRPTHPQFKKSRTKQHAQLHKSKPKTNPNCHARSTTHLVLLLLLVPTKAKEW